MYDEMTMTLFDGLLFAMEGENPSRAIELAERRATIAASNQSRLPRKASDHEVPWDIRLEGTTDDMDWDTKLKIVAANVANWTRQQYEKMGIQITSDYDDLFYTVVLPEGWSNRTTDHSMWNEVFDDKGRKRISYFYKGAFYDRDAFSNFLYRYGFRIDSFDHYETNASYEERKFKPWTLYITDAGVNIEELETITPETNEQFYAMDDNLRKVAVEWLNEHYPDWENIHSYWDD